jgi:ubiquinone/menaquinone biosynthesis C-methylase UbiE
MLAEGVKLLWKLRRRRHPAPQTAQQYWDERASRLGARSVVDVRHTEEEYGTVTQWQLNTLLPLFRCQLNGTEKLVLDFGCGPGRFTPSLAAAVGRAVGVDPTEKLIAFARMARRPDTRYEVASLPIPLPDASVDAIWCCLVLMCIPDATPVVAEMRRVIKDGGLVFLTENTMVGQSSTHFAYRSAREYTELFSFADLKDLMTYEDIDQQISVMAGRVKNRH